MSKLPAHFAALRKTLAPSNAKVAHQPARLPHSWPWRLAQHWQHKSAQGENWKKNVIHIYWCMVSAYVFFGECDVLCGDTFIMTSLLFQYTLGCSWRMPHWNPERGTSGPKSWCMTRGFQGKGQKISQNIYGCQPKNRGILPPKWMVKIMVPNPIF